jgi:RND family efflux transporter MFP subunit
MAAHPCAAIRLPKNGVFQQSANPVLYVFLLAFTCASTVSASSGHDHEGEASNAVSSTKGRPSHDAHDSKEHTEEENRVHLSPEQQHAAGIQVETLTLRPIPNGIEAPGELLLNRYSTSQVTPRIEAQAIERHARLGDKVKKGQPLVTLSSANMAEAQGALIIAAREWQRVKKLGLKVVSEQRYLESRVAYQQAWARLRAYGITQDQIDRLVKTGDVSRADGRFTLLSPQDGTIIRDEFVIGQMVTPGDLLFEITDESTIWVEAHVNPEIMYKVDVGTSARVQSGGNWYQGKVVQIHHALDETTRTMRIRIELPNPGDHLHPGQFVTARISLGDQGDKALILPKEAILRSPDGDWQVFVEKEAGEFEPVEIEVVRQLPRDTIIEGLPEGTRVVTQGAFFVQSELAKSGFAVHNH